MSEVEKIMAGFSCNSMPVSPLSWTTTSHRAARRRGDTTGSESVLYFVDVVATLPIVPSSPSFLRAKGPTLFSKPVEKLHLYASSSRSTSLNLSLFNVIFRRAAKSLDNIHHINPATLRDWVEPRCYEITSIAGRHRHGIGTRSDVLEEVFNGGTSIGAGFGKGSVLDQCGAQGGDMTR
ncbi:MAG: hypothetical protein M1818_003417 [Claussenomyces sp. TS43310]|nr:MAG: hypothetical protein M1818_003417 [Claussenomyces sp. TS43310]